jgi:hypothetical protein
VSRGALNHMEDILSTYYNFTLSAITHKLCVSEHMLVCTYFIVLVCGPRVQNLSVLFFLVCEAIGTAATPGLLCQPPGIVKMIVEKQMECRLAGETEVLGENLPQRHFCPSQNPT